MDAVEQFQLGAGDLLILDGKDLSDAVSRINHEFVGLEALTLGQHLFRLLDARRRGHSLGGRLVRDMLAGTMLLRDRLVSGRFGECFRSGLGGGLRTGGL